MLLPELPIGRIGDGDEAVELPEALNVEPDFSVPGMVDVVRLSAVAAAAVDASGSRGR
jgi:hypothetical protein